VNHFGHADGSAEIALDPFELADLARERPGLECLRHRRERFGRCREVDRVNCDFVDGDDGGGVGGVACIDGESDVGLALGLGDGNTALPAIQVGGARRNGAGETMLHDLGKPNRRPVSRVPGDRGI
jgi:hypothetical protein